MIVADECDRVVEWNEAASRLLGYEREEVLGRDLGRLIIPPDRLDEHRQRFAGLVQTETSELLAAPFETRLMRSTGEQITVLAQLTRTTTSPPNFVAFLRGPGTETLGAELNQLQLETIVDCSEDAMATLTVDGRVTTWNPAAAELYGFAVEEAIGRRLASLIVPAELAHEPRRWLREVLQGHTVERVTRRLRKDRSEVIVSVRMLPVRDERDRVIGSVMIAKAVPDSRPAAAREGLDHEAELWRARIDSALGGENFAFAAQPVIDLVSGQVDHHELLLRMPTGIRLAGAQEFIGHAECSRQVQEVDRWAVRRGIELAQHHPVAINVSVLSLASKAICEEIMRSLKQTRVDPTRITFEITETAAVEDLDSAVSFAEQLRAIGCGMALDDFGTGFGSFTYLNRLPVSELKIDQEFVGRLTTSAADRRIVHAIVDIARKFGARTVAEGIEDAKTCGLLRDLGVDLGQGYFLGVPFVVGRQWFA